MPLIKWDDSFSVQIAAMDKQHQNLFDLINKLHEAMGQGKGKDTLPEVFESLIKYTQVHFAAEEALLQKHNYPDLAAHKRLHADLIMQISELQKQFQAGDFSASQKTRDFLKQWLTAHIKETDLKYGVFLKQSGIN
jgi:hemerythrin